MTELRKGTRVSVPGMYGIPIGTVLEPTEMTVGTGSHTDTVMHGARVLLDDGRIVHRWAEELTVCRQVLAPVSRLVWHAMRHGARRVPDSTARVYEGNGIRLEVYRRLSDSDKA